MLTHRSSAAPARGRGSLGAGVSGGPGWRFSARGGGCSLILMILGALSLLLSIMFWSTWGGFNAGAGGGYRRQRRVTQDGAGGFVEEERADIPAA